MNYYEHHIGDYQKKTAHISIVEHGVYMLMLQAYYATEKPLPNDVKTLSRIVRATTRKETQAIVRIVSLFWRETPEGLVQDRARLVIAEYQAFIASQRAKGRSGADKRWGNNDSNGHSSGHGSGHDAANGSGHRPAVAGSMASHSQSHSHLKEKDITPKPPLEKGASQRRRSPKRAEGDVARLAWEKLIASKGAQRDARVQAAIEAIGGWGRISGRTQFDDARVRADFCNAYQSQQGAAA